VQIFLAYYAKGEYDWEKKHFGQVLQVMSAFMIAGAITTYWLVPETRDHDNKSRTLEVLACGKKVIDELNRKRREEDQDEG
jgi:PHS family inorganic phosphate transporter-like MFS transporter